VEACPRRSFLLRSQVRLGERRGKLLYSKQEPGDRRFAGVATALDSYGACQRNSRIASILRRSARTGDEIYAHTRNAASAKLIRPCAPIARKITWQEILRRVVVEAEEPVRVPVGTFHLLACSAARASSPGCPLASPFGYTSPCSRNANISSHTAPLADLDADLSGRSEKYPLPGRNHTQLRFLRALLEQPSPHPTAHSNAVGSALRSWCYVRATRP
jgi:hypothetical protein